MRFGRFVPAAPEESCKLGMRGFAPLLALTGILLVAGQQLPIEPEYEAFHGPTNSSSFASWYRDMVKERNRILSDIQFDDSLYKDTDLAWASINYIQPQVMVHDKMLYDRKSNSWTIQKFLDDALERYGGIDSILIWQAYPNLGIDDRNQWMLLDDLPAGGLAVLTEQFHSRNVKVFIAYNPWDVGTSESALPASEIIGNYVKNVKVDGFNGDTMYGVEKELVVGVKVVAQPEEGLPDQFLMYDLNSWAYMNWPDGTYFSFIPMVLRTKWLESRHQVQICNRWCGNKTADIQLAWFNGAGLETWENVWGVWNGLSPRDAETIRRMSLVYRHFGLGSFFSSPDWIPHVPITNQFGIFATLFPAQGTKQAAVWNAVNRLSSVPDQGIMLTLPCAADTLVFDLFRGQQLSPSATNTVKGGFFQAIGVDSPPKTVPGGTKDTTCDYHIAASAESNNLVIASFLSIRAKDVDAELTLFLQTMAQATAESLDHFSDAPVQLTQTMEDYGRTAPKSQVPTSMILVPGTDAYEFVVEGLEIEAGIQNGKWVDCQFPWEAAPIKNHNATIGITSFYMDKYPTTNADFSTYLSETKYFPLPGEEKNFLRDWSRVVAPDGQISYAHPTGWNKKPVNWITQEEARAYCAWAGKRLPNDWEWQFAAQSGRATRAFPWGDVFDYQAVPQYDGARNTRPLDDVDAHEQHGSTPTGIADLYGNAWEMTNVFEDARTRSLILRGGSLYYPQGSGWYFNQPTSLMQHQHFLLAAPSLDRSSMITFRCVADV